VERLGKAAPPCPFQKELYLLKSPRNWGSSPITYLDTLCLFNEFLVNQEKVLYFVKLKF
jgi:hypothetical protein